MARVMKRARELVPGDVMYFSTRPSRIVAEILHDTTFSQYPPHREYKIVWVRWEGDVTWKWKTSLSSWVVCVVPD